MIVDISNEVYTELKDKVSSATVYKRRPRVEPVFPCVILSFATQTETSTVDSSGETHNFITVNIDIYSQSTTFNSEILTIRKEIDSVLADYYKLERTLDEEMDNIDPDIYRWIMRYDGVASSDNIIYRR